jgi:small subunit ribosomal protein S18
MPRRFEREEERRSERGDRGGRAQAPKKNCRFCANPFDPIDYKNERQVRRLVSERGKILPRRATGNCAKHQREAALAVKYARHLALLPFVSEFHK